MSTYTTSIGIQNSSNVLVSTINPISGAPPADGNAYGSNWVYYLFTAPANSTENTDFSVSINNTTSGKFWACVLASPGLGGAAYVSDPYAVTSTKVSVGGGGGGSGACIDALLPTSTTTSSTDYNYTVQIAPIGMNGTKITGPNGFFVYPTKGHSGNDATVDLSGKGGSGQDCLSSDTNSISSVTTNSSTLTKYTSFYGGCGGGSGGITGSDVIIGASGAAGNATTLNGSQGNEGTEQLEDPGYGGTGGAISIKFSDGTYAVVEAGNGGNNGVSGETGTLPFIMLYGPNGNGYIVSSTTTTDPNSTITSNFNFSTNQYKISNSISSTTPNTEGISTSTINPFTYVSVGYTYLLFRCPECVYTDSSNNTYYQANWAVPNDGKTYYFSAIGPGGPGSNWKKNDGYAMGGGGGDSIFFRGTMINGTSYSYTMWDLSRNPGASGDKQQVTAKTYNILMCIQNNVSYKLNINGGNIPGNGDKSTNDGGAKYVYGGEGGDGMGYDSSMNFTNILSGYLVNGGGGGGGGCAGIYVKQGQDGGASIGDYGNGGAGAGGGSAGTDGTDGTQTNSSDWPPNKEGAPGETLYTFFDNSYIWLPAGNGGKGPHNSSSNVDTNAQTESNLINGTPGNSSWMMIYYKT